MTTEAIIDTLRKACAERKVCKLHKKGEPDDRIVNPHGIHHSKNKDLVLVCIQVKGYSKSKNGSGYRNLALHDFENVEMLPRTFVIDKDFNPDGDQYGDWLFHVLQK